MSDHGDARPIDAGLSSHHTGPTLSRHGLARSKRSAGQHTGRRSASSAIPARPTGERLTDTERADFERCDATIETSLATTAEALHTTLSRHLYRERYGSFEEYCKDRWGFSPTHGYRLARAHPIRSATEAVLRDRTAGGETNWLQRHSLPSGESLYREIPTTISRANAPRAGRPQPWRGRP